MKKFELPNIKIEIFLMENVVTTSGISGAAQELAADMQKTTGSNNVNIVSWDMFSE